MHKINDYVVYKRDVCKVNDITTSKYSGEEVYALAPIDDNSLKIEVPINNYNVRTVIDRKTLDFIIEEMPSIDIIDLPDKQLEAEYKRLFATDKIEDLVKIIKTSYLNTQERTNKRRRARDKDIIFFNKAENCLYNEFSVVLNKSFDETKKYVIGCIERDY